MARRPRPGEPVYGTSWRRHSERRLRAARIARLLRPVTHVMGGLVSTELAVPVRGHWHRPDVGVLLGGDIPLDGVLHRAPMLVVRLGEPVPAAAWVAAGAAAVWAWEAGEVVEVTRRHRRRLEAGQWLEHPNEPALRMPASEVGAVAARGTRIGA